MNSATKKAKLAKKIMETKQKIETLRENKTAPSATVLLIETELEKASLIMGAKNIVSDLQTQAEKLAKVEADQLMPIIDQLKTTFGTQAAEGFYRSATSALRELVDQIQKAKDTINDQIVSLENGTQGLPMNDMQKAEDGDFATDDADALGGDDAAMGDDLGDDLGTEAGSDDLGDEAVAHDDEAIANDNEFNDDEFNDDMASAAGRARKESVDNFEKAIFEFFVRAVSDGGYRPTVAAKIVAEGFRVDVSDVKTIVREAAGK